MHRSFWNIPEKESLVLGMCPPILHCVALTEHACYMYAIYIATICDTINNSQTILLFEGFSPILLIKLYIVSISDGAFTSCIDSLYMYMSPLTVKWNNKRFKILFGKTIPSLTVIFEKCILKKIQTDRDLDYLISIFFV